MEVSLHARMKLETKQTTTKPFFFLKQSRQVSKLVFYTQSTSAGYIRAIKKEEIKINFGACPDVLSKFSCVLSHTTSQDSADSMSNGGHDRTLPPCSPAAVLSSQLYI